MAYFCGMGIVSVGGAAAGVPGGGGGLGGGVVTLIFTGPTGTSLMEYLPFEMGLLTVTLPFSPPENVTAPVGSGFPW